MKAVILAGGEGTRLRPLTCMLPKPMLPITGKPILAHTLDLLKRNGVTDIAMTLMYMPQLISDYFGNGRNSGVENFNVDISYFYETSPLGTAGAVKQCECFYKNENFLVISGDAVCDFDLKEAMLEHEKRNADVTLILYKHKNPLEYGLVLTDENQNITRFVEKPSWSQVFSDTVNTGIYIISPRVMENVQKNCFFDFAKNLFPDLLACGAKLYGHSAAGYWCDVGDCKAYLQCNLDAVNERIKLEKQKLSAHFDEVMLIPPFQIHKDARIEKGSIIGPNVYIDKNSYIGKNCKITNSVISGSVGFGCNIEGAVCESGSFVGDGCVLKSGSVAGNNSKIGNNACLNENVKLWPETSVDDGIILSASLMSGSRRSRVIFENGKLSGAAALDITPEFCFELGDAIISAFAPGKICIGCCGADVSNAFMYAISSAVSMLGCEVIIHDCSFAAAAAEMANLLSCDFSIFFEENNEINIYIFDNNGVQIDTQTQRKIENILLRGEKSKKDKRIASKITRIRNAQSFYNSSIKGKCDISVVVCGEGSTSNALKTVLKNNGCMIAASGSDIPRFEISDDGMFLFLQNSPKTISDEFAMSGLLLAAEFIASEKKTLAVPYNFPASLDIIASQLGGKLLRVERDGKAAKDIYIQSKYLRDGIYAAVKLCEFLSSSELSLAELIKYLPGYYMFTLETDCKSDKGGIMRSIIGQAGNFNCELVDGLRINLDGGYVHISPSAAKQKIKITAESQSEEFAEEICIDYINRAKKADTLQIK